MADGRVGHSSDVHDRKALPRTIAIDGPAGAGKSTIADALAQRLGYLYFDTGVLYRAVTLAALRRGLAPGDHPSLAALVEQLHIDVLPPTLQDGRGLTVILDDEDVTWAIRTPEVDHNVSAVSAQPAVRQALLQRQRAVAARGGIIMAGRDIGTVVLPDADLKLYLEATPEERAQRRAVEEQSRGLERPFPEVLAEIERRDDIDSHRALSPLRPAADAIIVDTEGLDIDAVLATIDALLGQRA
ncbi:MAG: Cytidylate kinase [uncultured Thermomicrobiales bacterium]|uniref:Cytidylate kinase n=1 Tax=uncultured Thermomicrobiales bacterium TaxID=1645740 RepID=A0A6J4VTE0_9BACT|nr:MAG: Cytidylate kinase [uncultured Thermomicrobiales bacterium]